MVQKHSFNEFDEALDFLEKVRVEGRCAIYFPEGGDNPRRMTTETPRHIILILENTDEIQTN